MLNQWLLSLFDVSSIDELYGIMRDASEGWDENNVSRFHHRTERLFERPELPDGHYLGNTSITLIILLDFFAV